MSWHYACCRRQYQTVLPDGTEQPVETHYELVEAFTDGGYTADAVTVAADDSKEDLAKWLRKAADDVEKYDLIVDDDVVVHFMGSGK